MFITGKKTNKHPNRKLGLKVREAGVPRLNYRSLPNTW
jgi:hypothetical protein